MAQKAVSGIMLALLVLCVFLVYAGFPDEFHDADAMWIEPSTISLSTENPEHKIGYRFNITLWINLTVSCSGWQFKLLYNKNYLNATRAGYTAGSKSDFFKNITTVPVEPSFNSYNFTHNYVIHGEAWLTDLTRNPGYGSLSWVEFEVTVEPPKDGEIVTVLDIALSHHPPTSRTYAIDPDIEEIPLETNNSLYTFTYSAVLSTAVYFNLNPNPACVGETVTLRGIFVDELSRPLSNETVKLYARCLAGSWRYITSLTTDGYGIFKWQVKIPLTGTFIFAVYYPGSEMYESTYNLAMLKVQ